MATTKDRLEQLTNVERELHDRDVVAPEDIWGADAKGPPAAAGQTPAVTIPRSSLRSRLLEPITGRWAAIGAVAWVVLLGIGIAVEPQPTNPNAVDPWFLNVLGTVLLAAVVAAFAGFWLRQRWSMAASLLASSLLVVSTVLALLAAAGTVVLLTDDGGDGTPAAPPVTLVPDEPVTRPIPKPAAPVPPPAQPPCRAPARRLSAHG